MSSLHHLGHFRGPQTGLNYGECLWLNGTLNQQGHQRLSSTRELASSFLDMVVLQTHEYIGQYSLRRRKDRYVDTRDTLKTFSADFGSTKGDLGMAYFKKHLLHQKCPKKVSKYLGKKLFSSSYWRCSCHSKRLLMWLVGYWKEIYESISRTIWAVLPSISINVQL